MLLNKEEKNSKWLFITAGVSMSVAIILFWAGVFYGIGYLFLG